MLRHDREYDDTDEQIDGDGDSVDEIEIFGFLWFDGVKSELRNPASLAPGEIGDVDFDLMKSASFFFGFLLGLGFGGSGSIRIGFGSVWIRTGLGRVNIAESASEE